MNASIANLDAVRSFRVQKKSENSACNTQRWVYDGDMKTSFSELAERQTVRVNKINSRVSVRVRAWQSGDKMESTNDVVVDGYTYTPHVSENWLSQNLAKICDIVAGKAETHTGMGVWS